MLRSRSRQIQELIQQTFSDQTFRNKSDYLLSTTVRPAINSSTWKEPMIKKREHQTLEPKSKRRPFSTQSQRKGRMKLGNILHAKKIRKI